jgi:predicted anti-sigma-YlaC factor YlaD
MQPADERGKQVKVTDVVFPPDCEQTVRALWDYLDRALDTATMAAIDAHLQQCAYCREHLRFERALLDRIRQLRREHDNVAALRERVLVALYASGLPRN